MSFSIEGKTAIVTGGANGIGLAIGRHFADHGANVMFADMDEKRLKKELEDFPDDGNVRYFAGDLRERLTVANLLSATIDAFENIDILVNASRQVLRTDPLNVNDSSLETLIDQNLMTSYRITQSVAKRMIKQAVDDPSDRPAGSIINLSSVTGLRGQIGGTAYSASKAGVHILTKSVAMETAKLKIRCNSIHPGIIDTPIMDPAFAAAPDPAAMRAHIEGYLPVGYMGDPAHDIGNMAVFLASDESTYITGAEMLVDGGMISGLPQ